MNAFPQSWLMEDGSVTDIAFSSWWVNDAVQITSVQQQAAWAGQFERNLLASGIGRGSYNSGSGIYSSTGEVLASFFNPSFSNFISKLLLATVPLRSSSPSLSLPPTPFVVHFPSLVVASSLVSSSGHYIVHAGPLVCELRVVFAPTEGVPQDLWVRNESSVESARGRSGGAELMGLVGQHGPYNGIFNASICSFNRCVDESACTGWTVDSHIEILSFTLTAYINRSNYLFALPMMDTNNAQLFPSSLYTNSSFISSPSSSFSSFHIFPSSLSFDVHLTSDDGPLLNAAIFAVHHSIGSTT